MRSYIEHIPRMVKSKTDIVGSFVKGLAVLECFGADKPKLTITDVSEKSGYDRATARRCLLTLEHEGYAEFDGKYFTLTPRVLRLGMAALASLPMVQIVQPWLDQLSDNVGHSCSVAILDGPEIVYIARAAQRRVVAINLLPGSRLPAHCTSLGRVLLADLNDTNLCRAIETADLSPRTPFSLTDANDLIERIKKVRDDGYAIIDQEVEAGLRSIAVPLRNSRGKTVAALNIGMAATPNPASELAELYLDHLRRVQSGLERLL